MALVHKRLGAKCTKILLSFIAQSVLWQKKAYSQRDQIGRFLPAFGNKLYHKSNPNILMPFWEISNTVNIM